MTEKGYVLTWDAMISLSLVLFILVGFMGLHYFRSSKAEKIAFQKAHNVAEDSLEALNKKGILEEIGFLWSSGNYSEAANLSEAYLELLVPPNMGYRLEIVDRGVAHVIHSSGNSRVSEAASMDETRAARMLSGYREDAPREGWVARAWLVENFTWVIDGVCRDDGCGSLRRELNLSYYTPLGPGLTPGEDVFYVRVPLDSHLSYFGFNVSWSGEGPAPTTTSTSTSTTTVTSTSVSTTESTLPDCHDCPVVNDDCGIEAGKEFYTHGDDYNYHFFDVPAGSICDVEVVMQPDPDSDYDMYVNWTPQFCPVVKNGLMPYEWGVWDCPKHPIDLGFVGQPEACMRTRLGMGRYHVMVDCFNESFWGHEYCPGGYALAVNLYGEDCNPTATSSSSVP